MSGAQHSPRAILAKAYRDNGDIGAANYIEGGHDLLPDTQVHLLAIQDALALSATPSQGLDAATVRHCAEMVRDRAVTISASSLNGTPASEASKIAARHLIRAAEDMERALATDPHQHGGKGA